MSLRDRISLAWWRFRETRDKAWSDGYDLAHAEAEEYIEGKEVWIVQCEAAIQVLLESCMNEDNWEYLREHEPDLYEFLGAWA